MAAQPAPRQVTLDFEALNLAEQEKLCDMLNVTGMQDFVALVNVASPKAYRSIVTLLKQRDDPAYTYDDTATLNSQQMLEYLIGEIPKAGESVVYSTKDSPKSPGTITTPTPNSRRSRRASSPSSKPA